MRLSVPANGYLEFKKNLISKLTEKFIRINHQKLKISSAIPKYQLHFDH